MFGGIVFGFFVVNNKLTSVTDQCNTTRRRGNRWRYQQVSHYNPNYCKSFARIQLFL